MADKARERWYLDALLRVLPDAPPSKAFEDSETPDFIFNDPNRRLGVEITTFHLPPPAGQRSHQEQQSLKNQIVERAQEWHHAAGGPALYATVSFHPNSPLRKSHVTPLAKSIAESVLVADVPSSFTDPEVTIPWDKLPREIVDVHIQGSVNGDGPLWQSDAGGFVAQVAPEDVAAVVDGKAKALNKARLACDELWLVIVNDEFSNAAPADISESARETTYKCLCDRLIWLLPHGPQIIDLKLQ